MRKLTPLILLALALSACSGAQAATNAAGEETSTPSASAAPSSAPTAPAPTASAPDPAETPAPAPEPVKVDRLRAKMILPAQGQKVGIGMPVKVSLNRDVPKKYRNAVLAGMTVTANGQPVVGGWRWTGKDSLTFRPAEYWPGKARIKIVADLSQIKAKKFAGAVKTSVWKFRTGNALVLRANGASHQMAVILDGKKIKSIPISLGKPGWETRNGIKVIMTLQRNYTMRGTDENGPYEIQVANAFRITNSGEFVHSAPWSVGNQGRVNGSHGCTNVSPANGEWLADRLLIGTPVEYVKTGGDTMTETNGWGEWNVPDRKWKNAPPVNETGLTVSAIEQASA